VLAAVDDVTRQRCMRIIEAASAGASPMKDIASAAALTSDLLKMNLFAVNAVLAALGKAAVKNLSASSLIAGGFDHEIIAAFDHADRQASIKQLQDLHLRLQKLQLEELQLEEVHPEEVQLKYGQLFGELQDIQVRRSLSKKENLQIFYSI